MLIILRKMRRAEKGQKTHHLQLSPNPHLARPFVPEGDGACLDTTFAVTISLGLRVRQRTRRTGNCAVPVGVGVRVKVCERRLGENVRTYRRQTLKCNEICDVLAGWGMDPKEAGRAMRTGRSTWKNWCALCGAVIIVCAPSLPLDCA